MWDPPKQQEFAEDLCKLFIACNVSWTSANNPELFLFFSKYVPEAKIPDRRVLSGRVLDTLVLRVEKEMKDQVAGKLGIGQCDGWKTGAKASIISIARSVSTSFVSAGINLHLVATHDVSPEKKSADNLLEIVLGDIEYCETEFGIIHVGYCTDDGGDAKAMRKRLRSPTVLGTSGKPEYEIKPRSNQARGRFRLISSSSKYYASRFHAWSRSTMGPR
ncbi:hypothetical protein C8F04DRAFT_961451 [Mycena alexandri]|uniref:Uncharacterized protein n=1 Tax=Mycena alexandri TaxID=1745969 RepID=A0AAD6SQ75_9AGAR|nr:hypothetical protein C8F04DRAFT_961451 [Mycena alexandri]